MRRSKSLRSCLSVALFFAIGFGFSCNKANASSLSLNVNQTCPAGSICNYTRAYEDGDYQLSCSDNAIIVVRSSSYFAGSSAEACPAALATCAGNSSCNISFNNDICSGDPAPGQSKQGKASIKCAVEGKGGGLGKKTVSGVRLPQGWSLKKSDRFGTRSGSTVQNLIELHQNYYEGQFYNRNPDGTVLIPNVVINGEQQTYVHFEQAIAFSNDHLTIQAQGHPDNSITSAEMVSVGSYRSFCMEARYQIPSQAYAWPAFWQYGSATGNDTSELDFEQPITPYQGVNDVTMHNHPNEGTNIQIFDPDFTTQYMNYHNSSFDASSAPHYYTSCYDDSTQQISRYIDGKIIYSAGFQWNASLGGTGHGPDAAAIINLAVGGNWPGDDPNPSGFSAQMNVYSIDYYGP